MNAKSSSLPTHDDGRKPRSDGEQSRIRLLQAATRLFGNQGYSRTSTREIAQAAGANVAAISYYFGDKAGLYQACFAAMCEPAPDNIAQFDQPHYTLRQSLDGYYRQLLAPLLAARMPSSWCVCSTAKCWSRPGCGA
jgi:AcrR family transcriptional regulator